MPASGLAQARGRTRTDRDGRIGNRNDRRTGAGHRGGSHRHRPHHAGDPASLPVPDDRPGGGPGANQSAIGIKNVSVNELFFQGHFPDHPVMPGVLIIEAMAQTAAVLVVETLGPTPPARVVYFMSVEGAKFRRPVVPGRPASHPLSPSSATAAMSGSSARGAGRRQLGRRGDLCRDDHGPRGADRVSHRLATLSQFGRIAYETSGYGPIDDTRCNNDCVGRHGACRPRVQRRNKPRRVPTVNDTALAPDRYRSRSIRPRSSRAAPRSGPASASGRGAASAPTR